MIEQIKISEGATIAARHIYQHKRILFPEEDLPIIAEIIQRLAVAPVESDLEKSLAHNLKIIEQRDQWRACAKLAVAEFERLDAEESGR